MTVESNWGQGVLPKGPPKARWYDKYGREFILPSDPYSIDHYMERGLRLHPPESPLPLVETPVAVHDRRAVKPDIGMAEIAPIERKRGPDKKPRKKRRNRA